MFNAPVITSLATQPVTTIDDCVSVAQILAGMIDQVAQRKYPLSIRRGRSLRAEQKGESMLKMLTSKVIKAGSKTYFLDIKQTENGKSYLLITESRLVGTEKRRERSSLAVFPEHAQELARALMTLAQQLGPT